MIKEHTLSTKRALAVGGSTAFAPLIVAAAGEFARRACVQEISIRNEGSCAGLSGVKTGALDAAFVDVPYRDLQGELTSYPLAAFAIAFIANPSAGISALTEGRLARILSGRVRNWRDVGGANRAIELIQRDAASGIRSILAERSWLDRSTEHPIASAESDRAAAQAVQRSPGGFSYVALPSVHDLDVVPLAIDGVRPSNESVLAGLYPFWTCVWVVMRKDARDTVVRFVDHIVEQTDLCDLYGFIALNRMSTKESHEQPHSHELLSA